MAEAQQLARIRGQSWDARESIGDDREPLALIPMYQDLGFGLGQGLRHREAFSQSVGFGFGALRPAIGHPRRRQHDGQNAQSSACRHGDEKQRAGVEAGRAASFTARDAGRQHHDDAKTRQKQHGEFGLGGLKTGRESARSHETLSALGRRARLA